MSKRARMYTALAVMCESAAGRRGGPGRPNVKRYGLHCVAPASLGQSNIGPVGCGQLAKALAVNSSLKKLS